MLDVTLWIHQKSFVSRALAGTTRGAFSAPPDLLAGSWGKSGERYERAGREARGEATGVEEKGIPLRVKIMVMALK